MLWRLRAQFRFDFQTAIERFSQRSAAPVLCFRARGGLASLVFLSPQVRGDGAPGGASGDALRRLPLRTLRHRAPLRHRTHGRYPRYRGIAAIGVRAANDVGRMAPPGAPTAMSTVARRRRASLRHQDVAIDDALDERGVDLLYIPIGLKSTIKSRKDMPAGFIERQGIDALDGLERQLAIEMRKQRAAARRLPFQLVAKRVGIDRDQHQIALAGKPFRRGFGSLLGGGEMDEAVFRIDRRAAIDAGASRPRAIRMRCRFCRSASSPDYVRSVARQRASPHAQARPHGQASRVFQIGGGDLDASERRYRHRHGPRICAARIFSNDCRCRSTKARHSHVAADAGRSSRAWIR